MGALGVLRDVARAFWGAIAICLFEVIGFLNFPDCLDNKWRVGIALVSLLAYALGVTNGRAMRREEDLEAERATSKALEEGLRHKAQELREAREQLRDVSGENSRLSAALDEMQSEDRRRRVLFDKLNARDKWCIAHVWKTYPRKFSASKGGICDPNFDVLSEDVGVLRFHGEEVLGGDAVRVYSIAIDWRAWLTDHADELPKPTYEVPCEA